MRIILGLTLLLVGAGVLSCRVEGTSSSDRLPPGEWVRTAVGWERTDSWRVSPLRQPQLHPLIVAVGQGLFSVLALAAFRGKTN